MTQSRTSNPAQRTPQRDVIDVTELRFASFAAVLAHTSQDGLNSIIRDPDSGSSITLVNIVVSELQADNFLV